MSIENNPVNVSKNSISFMRINASPAHKKGPFNVGY